MLRRFDARIPELQAFAPHLELEFSLRGLTFTLELPNSDLMKIAGSWNGYHYVVAVAASFQILPR